MGVCCCPWCWKRNHSIWECCLGQKTSVQPWLTLALCSAWSLGRVITGVIVWAYSRPRSQGTMGPANRCLSRCFTPVLSSAKPFVRALCRKREPGEVAEHCDVNYSAGLLSLQLCCLVMRENMQCALVNQYTEQQRSDSCYIYAVFMIHNLSLHFA